MVFGLKDPSSGSVLLKKKNGLEGSESANYSRRQHERRVPGRGIETSQTAAVAREVEYVFFSSFFLVKHVSCVLKGGRKLSYHFIIGSLLTQLFLPLPTFLE